MTLRFLPNSLTNSNNLLQCYQAIVIIQIYHRRAHIRFIISSMKITINKKIERQKKEGMLGKKECENEEEWQQERNKFGSSESKGEGQEYQHCGKWIFQKCFRKPSNITEGEPENHCLAFTYQNIGYHQLKSKSTLRNNRKSCKRPPKINILSMKSKSVTKNNESNQHQSLLNSKNPTGATLTKQVYFESKKSDLFQTKQCTQAHKSYENSQQNSTNKLKSKLLDFSMKPSTIISSKNNSNNFQKSKHGKTIFHQGNFNSIISKKIIPFSINDVSELSSERIYTERIKRLEQKGEEFNFEGFSRFQLIQLEDFSARQREEGSDHSITTNYLKKKLLFSEQKSQRAKMEDCLYQPLYVAGNPLPQPQPHGQMKHHNHKSELIKAIEVDDERCFDSNKLNSQESVVLEKGLEEIFSPKLNGDVCEDNWSGYFMGYEGIDRIIED